MSINVTSTPYRERLRALLEGDLTFRNGVKSHLLHTLHAFAARFPPDLPRHFIEGLSRYGEAVLDPMAGSGVALTEAWLLSRHAIGIDIDPLAIRLCEVKTAWFDPGLLIKAGQRVVSTAQLRANLSNPREEFLKRASRATQDFLDYWFMPRTQTELAALVLSVAEEPDDRLRHLLEVLISSVIVTKSGGVSLARDLAHSRPHRVEDKVPRSAIKTFELRLRLAARAFGEIATTDTGSRDIVPGDARHLPLGKNCVDLIITSPPYANALDYVRAHKFSLVWLGDSIENLSRLRRAYIGAERWAEVAGVQIPADVQSTIGKLAEKDAHKARVLEKYYRDMTLCIKEMRRVLRPGRAAVLVVGPSTMRGLRIEAHNHLASIAREIGFDVVGVVKRALDRDRRMMPTRLNNNGQSQIELRIHEEFVLGLVKPDRE